MKQPTSLADYLSVWFSNYEPPQRTLHIRMSMFLALIFLYTAMSIEKSRSWFSLDLPFDSPIVATIFLLLSLIHI